MSTTSIDALSSKLEGYKKFHVTDPKNVTLVLDIVDIYIRLRLLDSAIEFIRQLSAEIQSTMSIELKLAETMVLAKLYPEAQILLEKLLHREITGEDENSVHYLLGLAKFYQAQIEQSLDHFEQAIYGGLKSGQIYQHLAYGNHSLGKLDSALEFAQKWVDISPNASSMGYLSLVFFDLEQLDQAKQWAIQAHNKDSLESNANVVLGSIAMLESALDTADKFFEVACEQNMSNGRAWLGKGLLATLRGQPEIAKAHLNQAHQLMPLHIGTLHAIGWIQFGEQDHFNAAQTFRQALDLDRNFSESHGALACSLIHLQDLGIAQEHVELAARLNPQNFAGSFARVLLYRHQGEPEKAEQLYMTLVARFKATTGKSLNSLLGHYLLPTSDKLH